MKQKNQIFTKKPTVALLLSDATLAREFSNIFRDLGILAHYYPDLPNFWFSCIDEPPDFSLVDVQLLSFEGMNILEHPKVVDKSVPLSFFCRKGDLPLLQSTYQCFHLGKLFEGQNYRRELQAILRRFNEINKLKTQVNQLQSELDRLNRANVQLVQNVQKSKQSHDYQKTVKGLAQFFQQKLGSGPAIEGIAEVLDSWDLCQEYSFFELSPNGQKLISPNLEVEKYRQLPSLWLGQVCKNGMEPFAINLAGQVAFDQMSPSTITLQVMGAKGAPEILILISTDTETYRFFPWRNLEESISHLYSRKLLGGIQAPTGKFQMDLPHFLQLCEAHHFNPEFSRMNHHKVFYINFSSLENTILGHPMNKFNYQAFHTYWNEWLAKVKGVRNFTFAKGLSSLVLVDGLVKIQGEGFVRTLKSFPFYRFFEDVDSASVLNIEVEIRELPLSSIPILNYLAGVQNPYSVETSTDSVDYALRLEGVSQSETT